MNARGAVYYCREDVTDKEIERNILANPFKRFEDMQTRLAME